jgi:ribA/ribD-fused uncharacterized protein
MEKNTITLYRPTGLVELELVKQSGFKRWPPRLPEQPIFYPVTNEAYAKQIATEWNVRESGVGFVRYQMAEKAALFGDRLARSRVLEAATPVAAKALGRGVSGFDEAVWAKHRFSIVARANQAKFTQNPELGVFLKQTGSRILVEASPVDNIWGIGLAQDDARGNNPSQWQGLNLLGFALMEIRNSL